MSTKKTFGELLKEERIKLKMSISLLGKRSGVDSGYLSRLERGEKDNPSADVVNKIANALNVSTDYLLGKTDDPIPTEYDSVSNADLEKTLEVLKQKKARWGDKELSDEDQEMLAGIIEAVKKRRES